MRLDSEEEEEGGKKKGSGSSPVCKSPVISIFILDERHVAIKQSKGHNHFKYNLDCILFHYLSLVFSPFCLSHLNHQAAEIDLVVL